MEMHTLGYADSRELNDSDHDRDRLQEGTATKRSSHSQSTAPGRGLRLGPATTTMDRYRDPRLLQSTAGSPAAGLAMVRMRARSRRRPRSGKHARVRVMIQ